MRTLLLMMKIITKFVYCITVGVHIMSYLLIVQPSTYNQRKMINTHTVYKADYDNIQPSCTIQHEVNSVYSNCELYPLSKVPNKDIILTH